VGSAIPALQFNAIASRWGEEQMKPDKSDGIWKVEKKRTTKSIRQKIK
jgi:hypothetical protein